MKTLSEYISTVEGISQMWEDINEILDDFDFEKVHKVMETLDWKWYLADYEDEDEELRVPTANEVRKRARSEMTSLITQMAEEGETTGFSNGGGIEATVEVIKDEVRKLAFGEDAPDDFKHSVELKLRFIVEENMPKTW